jgi:RHS repeat-associated protein
LIVSRTTSGVNTVRYIREDHLGGVAGIENPDGTSYVKESFTAFGDRRSSCTWTGSPTTGQLSRMAAATRRGFTFHTALGTMGLNDMNGRVEDAVIGRFLSADPHVTDRANTQNYNRYSYVFNNPLTFTDPTGFDASAGDNGIDTVYVYGNRETPMDGPGPYAGAGIPNGTWVTPYPGAQPQWIPTGGLPQNYVMQRHPDMTSPNDGTVTVTAQKWTTPLSHPITSQQQTPLLAQEGPLLPPELIQSLIDAARTGKAPPPENLTPEEQVPRAPPAPLRPVRPEDVAPQSFGQWFWMSLRLLFEGMFGGGSAIIPLDPPKPSVPSAPPNPPCTPRFCWA